MKTPHEQMIERLAKRREALLQRLANALDAAQMEIREAKLEASVALRSYPRSDFLTGTLAGIHNLSAQIEQIDNLRFSLEADTAWVQQPAAAGAE